MTYETQTAVEFGETVTLHRFVCHCGYTSVWLRDHALIETHARNHLRSSAHGVRISDPTPKAGPWVVACEECGFRQEYPTQGYAAGGVNAHQRETGHHRMKVDPGRRGG